MFDNSGAPFHILSNGEVCAIVRAPSFFGSCPGLQNVSQPGPVVLFSVLVAVPPGVSCQLRALDRIFATFRHSLAQF